jgi:hypothetical protein
MAALISLAIVRCLPTRYAKRYATACGFAISFFVGYLLLPDELRASLRPSRYWHWLPYVALVGMIIGPVALSRGRKVISRTAIYLSFALLTAWWLMPNWKDLDPVRAKYIVLLAVYFVLLIALLDPLPGDVSPRLFNVLLWVAAVFSTGAVWASISETYGRVGAVAASAWGGMCVASWVMNSNTTSRATIPLYATLIGGLAFVGFVYPPDETIFMTMVVPAVPLVLWMFVRGRLSKLTGRNKAIAQALAVLISGVVVASLVVFF